VLPARVGRKGKLRADGEKLHNESRVSIVFSRISMEAGMTIVPVCVSHFAPPSLSLYADIVSNIP
jgi:hypothetical protein